MQADFVRLNESITTYTDYLQVTIDGIVDVVVADTWVASKKSIELLYVTPPYLVESTAIMLH